MQEAEATYISEGRVGESRGAAEHADAGGRPVAASIIVPVYNCAPYLEQCLDSIVGQTASDWELICVDDGSSDGSLAIVNRYAAADGRIRVLEQAHGGPGKARNTGIGVARGEYLLFVDADDFIDVTLLEKALARARETDADIVAWDIWFFNNRYQRLQHPPEGILDFAAFDTKREVFSWRDNPDQILLSFQNWPWNKLFKAEFVACEGLVFREDISRSEDISFVCLALVRAHRIACVGERLISYRTLRADSAMATKDRHAFDFYEALLGFKQVLEAEGVFADLERGFSDWALSSTFYNLHTLASYPSFCEVLAFMKETGFEQLGLLGRERAYHLDPSLHDELQVALASEPGAYAFHRMRIAEDARENAAAWMDFTSMDERALAESLRVEIAEQTARADAAEEREAYVRQDLEAQLNSAEHRIGAALCALPRAVQRAALARKSESR